MNGTNKEPNIDLSEIYGFFDSFKYNKSYFKQLNNTLKYKTNMHKKVTRSLKILFEYLCFE